MVCVQQTEGLLPRCKWHMHFTQELTSISYPSSVLSVLPKPVDSLGRNSTVGVWKGFNGSSRFGSCMPLVLLQRHSQLREIEIHPMHRVQKEWHRLGFYVPFHLVKN